MPPDAYYKDNPSIPLQPEKKFVENQYSPPLNNKVNNPTVLILVR